MENKWKVAFWILFVVSILLLIIVFVLRNFYSEGYNEGFDYCYTETEKILPKVFYNCIRYHCDKYSNSINCSVEIERLAVGGICDDLLVYEGGNNLSFSFGEDLFFIPSR